MAGIRALLDNGKISGATPDINVHDPDFLSVPVEIEPGFARSTQSAYLGVDYGQLSAHCFVQTAFLENRKAGPAP